MDRPDLPIEGVPDASGELAEAAIRPDDIDGIGESGWDGLARGDRRPTRGGPRTMLGGPGEPLGDRRRRSRPDHRDRSRRIANVRASGRCSGCWARLPIRRPRRRPGSHSPRMKALASRTGSTPTPTSSLSGVDTSKDTEALPALPIVRDEGRSRGLLGPFAGRIVRSLVTALDGEGRGTIVISVRDGDHRRTAAFRCDVRLGILDVVGEVEPEHPYSGGLIDEWIERADGDYVPDVPELAVRLLGGCLGLSGPAAPARVRAWVEGVVGPGGLPRDCRRSSPGRRMRSPSRRCPRGPRWCSTRARPGWTARP